MLQARFNWAYLWTAVECARYRPRPSHFQEILPNSVRYLDKYMLAMQKTGMFNLFNCSKPYVCGVSKGFQHVEQFIFTNNPKSVNTQEYNRGKKPHKLNDCFYSKCLNYVYIKISIHPPKLTKFLSDVL